MVLNAQGLRQLPPPQWHLQQPQWLRVASDIAGVTAAGGCAGIVMWATVLPIDVAKTRQAFALICIIVPAD